ncbi:MAG: precorrin-8X methylmutase [Cyanobacteria bacterium J06554_11]
MPAYREHEITLASFSQIDEEIGGHDFTPAEYAVLRRVIHTTADFEFRQLVQFRHGPIEAAMAAMQNRVPLITDVSMVAAGIETVMKRTWQAPVVSAIQQAPLSVAPEQTRSAAGMLRCLAEYPGSIVAVGNAPTALLALCEEIASGRYRPALVVGAPVGFINVVESKRSLSELAVPHILVNGRKGGSAVAAAILNALMIWTWEQ